MIARRLLFDTSSARSISRIEVEQLAAAGYEVRAPPYAAWEMLCHLDEIGQFQRIRGNLLKLRRFEFFDDPVATTEWPLGIAHQPPEERPIPLRQDA